MCPLASPQPVCARHMWCKHRPRETWRILCFVAASRSVSVPALSGATYFIFWLNLTLFDFREIWKTSSCGSSPKGTTSPILWSVSETSLVFSLWVECNIISNITILVILFWCVTALRDVFIKTHQSRWFPQRSACRPTLLVSIEPRGGLKLPPLCLRSRVPLQYPDEPREAHGVSAQSAPRWQSGGKARGEAAGAQTVPVHSETSTHRNADYVWRWAARPWAILFFFFFFFF